MNFSPTPACGKMIDGELATTSSNTQMGVGLALSHRPPAPAAADNSLTAESRK
jgi:hypothetical protein